MEKENLLLARAHHFGSRGFTQPPTFSQHKQDCFSNLSWLRCLPVTDAWQIASFRVTKHRARVRQRGPTTPIGKVLEYHWLPG